MSSEEITDDASGGKDESKDNNPYEPKEKPKLIRVLTVFAYILSVSMAAILLSCYYVFVWDAHPHIGSRIQEEPAAFIVDDRSVDTVSPSTLYRTTTGIVAERLENPINFTTTSATLSSTTDYDVGDERLPEKFIKRSIFMKKLLHEQHFNDILKDVTDHTRGLS